MPEVRQGVRKVPALRIGRRHGEVREVRQFASGQAGHLLRRFLRRQGRRFRLSQILFVLQYLLGRYLQYLSLTAR